MKPNGLVKAHGAASVCAYSLGDFSLCLAWNGVAAYLLSTWIQAGMPAVAAGAIMCGGQLLTVLSDLFVCGMSDKTHQGGRPVFRMGGLERRSDSRWACRDICRPSVLRWVGSACSRLVGLRRIPRGLLVRVGSLFVHAEGPVLRSASEG